MQIKLFKTNDPANKVDPSLTEIATLDGHLKEPTSRETPTVLFLRDTTRSWSFFTDVNVVYINAFKRYYNVTGIEFVSHDRVSLSLSVNELKTFATDIKAASLFVARNENTYDAQISDPEHIVKEGNEFVQHHSSTTLFTPATPTYVVQTASDNQAISIYIMNEAAFKDLINGFWALNWSAIVDLGQASKFVVKSFLIPCALSSIVSKGTGAYDFVAVSAIAVGNSSISLTSTGYSAYIVSKDCYVLRWATEALTIPAIFNDWRDSLTEYYFYFPYCGELRVNGAAVNGADNYPSVWVNYDIDLTSGDIGAEIEFGASLSLSYYLQGNCALQVPITSDNVVSRISNFAGGTAQLAGGVYTGNVSSVASSVPKFINSIASQISFTGGVNASLGWKLPQGTYYQTKTREYVTNYAHSRGRPLYQWKTGSSLSGFTIIENAQIAYSNDPAPTVNEMVAVKSALESGVIF